MPVAKLSITIEEADLKWVRAEAKRLGKSVSAVVSDAVAQKDAIVMASAAQRGDVVYTSDVPDLQLLARAFPEVRILGA
jgi:predicted nucleotidyltransferase